MDTKLSKELLQQFSTDLMATYRIGGGRYEDLDFAVVRVKRRGETRQDLQLASGVDNIVQAIIHRLKTCYGELAPLGHPDYGSRHNELIGEPNTAHNRSLVKLYILQALAREPRIEKILRAELRYDRRRDPSRVDIVLELKLGIVGEVINLVVPFYFEAQA